MKKKNTNICNKGIGSLLWGMLAKIFPTKPQLSTDPQFYHLHLHKVVNKKGHVIRLPVLPYFRGKKEKDNK